MEMSMGTLAEVKSMCGASPTPSNEPNFFAGVMDLLGGTETKTERTWKEVGPVLPQRVQRRFSMGGTVNIFPVYKLHLHKNSLVFFHVASFHESPLDSWTAIGKFLAAVILDALAPNAARPLFVEPRNAGLASFGQINTDAAILVQQVHGKARASRRSGCGW